MTQTNAVKINNSGRISFDDGVTGCIFYHFYVTHTTYAALTMMNGDAMSKKLALTI